MKLCNKCLVEKPHSAFWKDKQRADGLNYSCKECLSAERKSASLVPMNVLRGMRQKVREQQQRGKG